MPCPCILVYLQLCPFSHSCERMWGMECLEATGVAAEIVEQYVCWSTEQALCEVQCEQGHGCGVQELSRSGGYWITERGRLRRCRWSSRGWQQQHRM